MDSYAVRDALFMKADETVSPLERAARECMSISRETRNVFAAMVAHKGF